MTANDLNITRSEIHSFHSSSTTCIIDLEFDILRDSLSKNPSSMPKLDFHKEYFGIKFS